MRQKIFISMISIIFLYVSCKPLQTSTKPSETLAALPSTATMTTFSTVRPTVATPIPFPALSVDQAEAKLIELLRNNGGCRLPCFWGFMPGQTDEKDVYSDLHMFNEIAPYGNGMIIVRDAIFFKTNVTVSGMMGNQDSQTIRHINVSMTAYTDETKPEGFVHGNPYFNQYFQYYTLPFLLSTYGIPENAYIGYENQMGLENLYTLILNYTSSGWIARFDMAVEEGPDPLQKTATGCPNKAFITLYLWEPNDTATRDYYSGNNFREWVPIEKGTGLTLDEFYRQYKNPANTKCLKTSVSIRP